MHLGLGKSDGCLKLDCTLPTTIIIGVTVSFLHAPWLPTCSSCIRNASSIFYYTLLLQLQHYIMPIKEGQRWCTLPGGSVSCHKWEMMLPNPITICHVHRDRGCLAPSKWKKKKKRKKNADIPFQVIHKLGQQRQGKQTLDQEIQMAVSRKSN